MQDTRKAALLLGLAALGLASPGAHAQTLTGPHDNSPADGYDAIFTYVIVPADSGGAPSATFNDNGGSGLYVEDAGASVLGGQFSGNTEYGAIFTNSPGSSAFGYIAGGSFADEIIGVEAENNSTIIITGGSFTGNTNDGVSSVTGSQVFISGGQYSGNTFDFFASRDLLSTFPGGDIDLYGSFTDPATGRPLASGQTLSLTGDGTFSGTLANNAAAQTYTYRNLNAAITLHDISPAATPAPEPSSVAAFAFTGLGAAGLMLKARKRRSAA